MHESDDAEALGLQRDFSVFRGMGQQPCPGSVAYTTHVAYVSDSHKETTYHSMRR